MVCLACSKLEGSSGAALTVHKVLVSRNRVGDKNQVPHVCKLTHGQVHDLSPAGGLFLKVGLTAGSSTH
jgi:hypothetical protein